MRSALSCEIWGGAAYAFRWGDEPFSAVPTTRSDDLASWRRDSDDLEVTWKWPGIHLVRS
jgi:hypothetical protein